MRRARIDALAEYTHAQRLLLRDTDDRDALTLGYFRRYGWKELSLKSAQLNLKAITVNKSCECLQWVFPDVVKFGLAAEDLERSRYCDHAIANLRCHYKRNVR